MSVASKVRAVMKKVGYLTKDGHMQGAGNYRYLSAEKAVGELQPAFTAEGLVIMPVGMEIVETREDTTKSGNVMHNVRIRVVYRLIDADEQKDSQPQEIMAFGEGSDTGDKALAKAMTNAYKYALLQTCMISSGDDPDHTASQEATASETHSRALPAQSDSLRCEWPDCGKPIKATATFSLEKIVELSRKKCDGHVLCFDHRRDYQAGERWEATCEQCEKTFGPTVKAGEKTYLLSEWIAKCSAELGGVFCAACVVELKKKAAA